MSATARIELILAANRFPMRQPDLKELLSHQCIDPVPPIS